MTSTAGLWMPEVDWGEGQREAVHEVVGRLVDEIGRSLSGDEPQAEAATEAQRPHAQLLSDLHSKLATGFSPWGPQVQVPGKAPAS
jgi:hypothetical protein